MFRCENKLKGHNIPYLKVQPPSESWTKFISFTVLKTCKKIVQNHIEFARPRLSLK